jgi:outer membrane protein OmpA-like peptidoglycan-associated protein
MNKLPLALALVALTLTSSLPAKDIAGSKDYPGFKRFEGSDIIRYKYKKFDKYSLYTKDKWIPLEGSVTRLAYKAPAGSSALEVYRNYEAELKTKKVQPIHAGPFADFSGDPDLAPWSIDIQGVQDGQEVIGWRKIKNPYGYIGKIIRPEGDLYVSLAVVEVKEAYGAFKVDDVILILDVVEIKGVTLKMVDGSAADMGRKLVETGRLNLYGLYFDTGKTELKAESDVTLREVAALLQNEASLKLQIIGHTDNVGGEKYNDELSRGRAAAVVQDLVQRGIAASRLTAEGKGLHQPVAPNDTEEGRAKNRRVELVKI